MASEPMVGIPVNGLTMPPTGIEATTVKSVKSSSSVMMPNRVRTLSGVSGSCLPACWGDVVTLRIPAPGRGG